MNHQRPRDRCADRLIVYQLSMFNGLRPDLMFF